MISKFFEMLFSRRMTKYDEICLKKKNWTNDDAWWLKKKDV